MIPRRPEDVRADLEGRQWDEGFLNGTRTWLICPMCFALVVSTKPGDPYDGRAKHTTWHVDAADVAYSLQRPFA